MRSLIPASLILAIAVLSACGGASPDPGTRALLAVTGAQFVEGPLPMSTAGGPHVASVEDPFTSIYPGQRQVPLRGAVDLEARSVAIGLAKDAGYWLIPAAPPSFETPGFASFDVLLDFSERIAPGALEIDVLAGGSAGTFGPADPLAFSAAVPAPPDGALVITLSWDTESDLDLHVVDPDGMEIWARNINSAMKPPVGSPPDPMAQAAAGTLDFDSNANCVIDGRRVENVVYTMGPPPGHYRVRVDAFSLCGEAVAHWTLEARHHDQVFARAHGTATDFDTRFGHDLGAGVLALELDEP
jgi:hypothetical protein